MVGLRFGSVWPFAGDYSVAIAVAVLPISAACRRAARGDMLAAPRAGCRRPRHALKIIGMRRRLAASWARAGRCGSAVGVAAAAETEIEPGGCSTFEVARPERDRGVDLIAYLDLDEAGRFVSCPIQMKAARSASFSLYRKYERIAQLLLVHVWYVNDPDQACAYALRYDEAKAVADRMGWTATDSWHRGEYSTTRPSQRLLTMLAPYRMETGDWRRKVQEAGTAKSL